MWHTVQAIVADLTAAEWYPLLILYVLLAWKAFHWAVERWARWRRVRAQRREIRARLADHDARHRTRVATAPLRDQVRRDVSARLARRLDERGDSATPQFTRGPQSPPNGHRLDRDSGYGETTSLRLPPNNNAA